MADTQRDDLQAAPGPQDSGSTEVSATEVTPTAVNSDTTPAAAGEPSSAAAAAAGAAAPEAAPAAGAPEPPPPSEPTSAAQPTLEASTTVPALGAGGTAAPEGEGEGGEWNLLVEKLQQWWRSGELQNLWQQAKTPLTIALVVISVLLVLRVYAGLLAAVNSLPLVPGLLELVGLIWALRFGLPKVIRRSEREQLIAGLQRRWRSFSGQG
jgi:hypothetical protein